MDTADDINNCGGCNTVCAGTDATCYGGHCTVSLNGGETVAQDADYLYFTVADLTGAVSIQRTPKSGGTTEVVQQFAINYGLIAIAVADSTVFAVLSYRDGESSTYSLVSIPVTGGTQTAVIGAQVNQNSSLAANGSYVYAAFFVESSAGETNIVYQCSSTTCTQFYNDDQPYELSSLVSGFGSLVWDEGPPSTNAIYLNDGFFFGTAAAPIRLGVDATNVYWQNGNTAELVSCPLTHCIAPTTLSTGIAESFGDIASDGTDVYLVSWTNTGPVGDCYLYQCAAAGGGCSEIAQVGAGCHASSDTYTVLVDDANVYWSPGGGIFRTSK